jgi:hypothetical protein
MLFFTKTRTLLDDRITKFVMIYNLIRLNSTPATYHRKKIKRALDFGFGLVLEFKRSLNRQFSYGFFYIRNLILILTLDSLITDDEPLWEPIEWSLVQTWIFYIFFFAWIAENLITSRYGSYTGRDKRVWLAWYKSFWLIDLWFIISYGAAALFVIVPFYYEITYQIAFVVTWWDWYTRVFFFKFIGAYTCALLVSQLLIVNVRWLGTKKLAALVAAIVLFLGYLLYFSFFTSFFGYFTNPVWYRKTRTNDYIQLSQEPLKWGWGAAKHDHMAYHKSSTIFWFKNDNPFAGALLMLHLFIFLNLFFTFLYWLILLRRVVATDEINYTFVTYCCSALRQFFMFFNLLYVLIFISFLTGFWRFPLEFLWLIDAESWCSSFVRILRDYLEFLLTILR